LIKEGILDFETALVPATLIRRYKRFLADVAFDDGTETTVHTPNTGSMLGCQTPGSRIWLLPSTNPKRKYPFSWELVESLPGVLVGINTGRSNRLVEEALQARVIKPLAGYREIRREVTLEGGASRLDFLLSGHRQRPPCYLEVKNVTAAVSDREAFFPDAVSTRATKHLRELQQLLTQGYAAALVFCVQRADVGRVRPAWEIDPEYAKALKQSRRLGVQVMAYGAEVTLNAVTLMRRLPVRVG
jgi:sugar fermentation stimulation protein A